MVRFATKNGYQKTFLIEIELPTQNMITIMSSIVNIYFYSFLFGGVDLYDHLINTVISTLILSK